MDAANSNQAAPNHQRNRVTPGKNAAMDHGNLRAFINSERAQALGFTGREIIPRHGDDFSLNKRIQQIKGKRTGHTQHVAERRANCN